MTVSLVGSVSLQRKGSKDAPLMRPAPMREKSGKAFTNPMTEAMSPEDYSGTGGGGAGTAGRNLDGGSSDNTTTSAMVQARRLQRLSQDKEEDKELWPESLASADHEKGGEDGMWLIGRNGGEVVGKETAREMRNRVALETISRVTQLSTACHECPTPAAYMSVCTRN